MKEQVELHYNRIFSLFIVASTTLMTTLIALGLFAEVSPEEITGNDSFYFGIAGIFCFGLTIYFLKKYLIPSIKNQSAVVINADCIVDNIKNITIQWENVTEVKSVTSRYSSLILIYLNNPEEITGNTNNWFKKLMYILNKLFYGTAIVISTQFISGNNFNLLNQFLPFLHKQKQVTT